MATQILALAILVLTCITGVWTWLKRRLSEKRKIAEEAREEYEEAIKSGDTSRITAALSKLNRL
jgi:uncharacterized membrane protein (DUF106 family)